MRRRTPLSRSHPEIAQCWCYEKNCGFGPEDFSFGSNVKAWWYCVFDKQHVFQQIINARVDNQPNSPHGCPYCASKKVSATNSLQFCAPAVAAQWHPSKNGKLRPDDVIAQSDQHAWWLCPACNLSWQAQIHSRVGDATGCPYCASKKVASFNSLRKLFPKVASEWHWGKNKRLKPDLITASSNKVVWWRCKQFPEHEWQAKVLNRTANGSGCPFCAGKKVSRTNSLLARFPELAREWHPVKNGELKPQDVTGKSKKIVWWRCPKDSRHEWEKDVCARSSRGQGCPFCAGQRVNETNSLKALFPELAKEWHPERNGSLTPADVTAGTGKKAWWRCSKDRNHEWEASIWYRSSSGSGCPFCRPWRGRP